MGDILIIEPYRMLQHAFSATLFAGYQVQFLESIPEPEAAGSADLVIVDAGALRERGSLHAQGLRAVGSWRAPTVWIDREKSAQAPTRDNLIAITGPLTKEILQKALAQCLKSSGAEKAPSTSLTAPKADASEPEIGRPDADKNVIELVEVVEEGSARQKSHGS
jgi:hypothetical protein